METFAAARAAISRVVTLWYSSARKHSNAASSNRSLIGADCGTVS